jgi:hypothetical protein
MIFADAKEYFRSADNIRLRYSLTQKHFRLRYSLTQKHFRLRKNIFAYVKIFSLTQKSKMKAKNLASRWPVVGRRAIPAVANLALKTCFGRTFLEKRVCLNETLRVYCYFTVILYSAEIIIYASAFAVYCIYVLLSTTDPPNSNPPCRLLIHNGCTLLITILQ